MNNSKTHNLSNKNAPRDRDLPSSIPEQNAQGNFNAFKKNYKGGDVVISKDKQNKKRNFMKFDIQDESDIVNYKSDSNVSKNSKQKGLTNENKFIGELNKNLQISIKNKDKRRKLNKFDHSGHKSLGKF